MFYFKFWKNDVVFVGFLKSFGYILLLCELFDLMGIVIRVWVYVLIFGVMVCIFCLIEIVVEVVVYFGWERFDVKSFGDDLVLLLVLMM